ncbi:hypothetical protein [Sorangium sp. So ce861]|uniref:hypothetical protein n=1 Tax=Sorangium sp. So ce861 TaxID=3133323 RepID=UPI003F62EBED
MAVKVEFAPRQRLNSPTAASRVSGRGGRALDRDVRLTPVLQQRGIVAERRGGVAFAVTFTQGGKVIFPSVVSSGQCKPQGFFVTPLSPQALSYLDGTITVVIESDKIVYDVKSDTGGQSTSDSWTVTTRG